MKCLLIVSLAVLMCLQQDVHGWGIRWRRIRIRASGLYAVDGKRDTSYVDGFVYDKPLSSVDVASLLDLDINDAGAIVDQFDTDGDDLLNEEEYLQMAEGVSELLAQYNI